MSRFDELLPYKSDPPSHSVLTKQQLKEARLKLEYKYKEQHIADELEEFYADAKHRAVFEEKLIPLMDKNDGSPSQRSLEQFYTFVIREHNLCYFLSFDPIVYPHERQCLGHALPKQGLYPFNLLDVHDTQVINVQKRFANPFRRLDKFEYTTQKGVKVTTTVCQLKFFAPWIQFGIVDPLLQTFRQSELRRKKLKRGRKPLQQSSGVDKQPTGEDNSSTDPSECIKRQKTSDQTTQHSIHTNESNECKTTNESEANVCAKDKEGDTTMADTEKGKKYYKNGPSMLKKCYVFEYTAYVMTPFLPNTVRVITKRRDDHHHSTKQSVMNEIMYMDVANPLPLSYRPLSCRVIVSTKPMQDVQTV
jgi:hypothetical protein